MRPEHIVFAGLAVALSALSAAASERVDVRAGEHPGFARIALQWKEPVTYQTKLDGETLTIHFARPFTAPLNGLARALGHYVAAASLSTDGTSIVATLKQPVEIRSAIVNRTTIAVDLIAQSGVPAKPVPAKPQAQIAPPPAIAAAAPAPPPAPPNPPPSPASAQTAASTPTADTIVTGPPPENLTPALIPESDSVSLRFDWPITTGAAVYRRGAALWIVFAAQTKLDVDAIRGDGKGPVMSADQVTTSDGTALRLVVADGLNPSVRRAGTSWIVDLKKQDAAPDAPITVEPRPGATVPSVELHVHQASAALTIVDPILGDTLLVVPVAELGRGIDATRSFVDFRLLPTVQGVAVRPNTDDLQIHADDASLDISRPSGLALSDERDRMLGGAVADQHRIFDFAAWGTPDNETFIERRGDLDRAVAAAPPAERTRPRIDLARFYFANFFGAETLPVLAQIEHDDPQAATDPGVRAMKGAACLLAGEIACAEQELGRATLDDEPEAALWRGSLAAVQADWTGASREFLRGIGLISLYPKTLRDRFALQAARALLETDRASAAGPLIDMVQKDAPDLGEQAMALYLAGQRQAAFGELEPALETWVNVAAMGDRKARALALYARAMALYDAKKASRLDTINALDSLRFAWRGDDFEFTVLKTLGELDLAEGDIDGALQALHEDATYFPSYPDAKAVAQEASDAFANLFIGKGADDMPPVKALALYDQFHDLEPAGARHDAIVRKLVDRLVSVDLLDRAASLLDDQVKNRLTGRDKARGATQLALLRLMNRQPDQAIAALDIDPGQGLDADLTRQRLELRARALVDLGKTPDALGLLAADNSRDAQRLRADIYWRQQDWKDEAATFAALVGAPPATGKLDAATQSLVMAWAAALTLGGDNDGLARLRHDFGSAMTGTPTAQAFGFMSEDMSASSPTAASASDMASRIAEIGTLQSFMSAYKDRLSSGGLSAIN